MNGQELHGTHPIIVKHARVDLAQDIASRLLERKLDVDARFRTRLDKEQALLLRPQLTLLRRDLAFSPGACCRRDICPCLYRRVGLFGVAAQVHLVTDENARQVWVGVLADVLQPRAYVLEACAG